MKIAHVKSSVALIGLIWVLLLLHFVSVRTALDNQSWEVNEGDVFLYSHDWDTPNPFEKIEVDTVVVVSIKDDYVKWSYGNGYYLSGELRFFKHYIRQIKNHENSTKIPRPMD